MALSIEVIPLADHELSRQVVIKNSYSGFQVTLLSYGAMIKSILTRDKVGVVEEVSLCYSTVSELKEKHGPYFGCVVGRFANRVRYIVSAV